MCTQELEKDRGLPLISCIMPTYGRPDYVNEAIAMFLAQDYPRKELVVLNDCPGQVFCFEEPGVSIFNAEKRYPTLGEKRNAAIALARGDIIAIWDDDDVYLPWRLSFSLREMQRIATEFYRPAEFWAYWGDEPLHHNQSIPGWVNHGTVAFTKSLWQRVGGYPSQDLNEDSVFFDRIHRSLGETFLAYQLEQEDRFFVLRGKSKYAHMSIRGGESPLDLTPGSYSVEPAPLADISLRQQVIRLIETHREAAFRKTLPSPLLSVCVALKNRSLLVADGQTLELFPAFVRSLAVAAEQLAAMGTIELVVADFQSDDWPLEQWLEAAAGQLRVKIVPLEAPFSRGQGLNAAVAAASSDRLFLCDADMLVQSDAILRAVQIIDAGRAWFPTYECLDRQGRPEFWQDFSYGMAAVSRDHFRRAGPIPEFHSWGGEDDVFYASVARYVSVLRERSPYLQHQWHPEASRHENYTNPRKSDYHRHLEKDAANSSPHEAPLYCFYARHPHWEGKVHLFGDGRMSRPGVDFGCYEMTSERIVINWDRWGAETLLWDQERDAFHDAATGLILKPLGDASDVVRGSSEGRLEQQFEKQVPERVQYRMLSPIVPAPLQTFYHVACLHHWQDVVTEQIELFHEVGLQPCIGVLGSEEDAAWIRRKGLEVGFHSHDLQLYETPTLRMAWDWAQQHPEGAVLYAHTKWVSVAHDTQRIAWRKLMSSYLIRPWRRNLEHLAIVDAVGVNWVDYPGYPHYSGNFWMARADWLAQLPSPTEWKNRSDPDPRVGGRPWNPMADEMWIGSKQPCQVVSLAGRNQILWEGPDVYRSLPATGKKLSDIYWGLADRTDKGTVHSYLEFYEENLREFRDRSITLVEVGISNGGSIDLWDRYFTHSNTRIIGVDVDAASLTSGRIALIQANGCDRNVPRAIGSIDVVIDNGSRDVLEQIETFQNYYPQLKPGGLYVIEDVACDEAATRLHSIHPFAECDLRHVKNRCDDRIFWTRKSAAEPSGELRVVSAWTSEMQLKSSLPVLTRQSCLYVCICAGFCPSLELRARYPHVEFRTLPHTGSEASGSFCGANWLEAFTGIGEEEMLLFVEDKCQPPRELEGQLLQRMRAFDLQTLSLAPCRSIRNTLLEESLRINLPNIASKIYQAEWDQIPSWDITVIAGRAAAFRRLRLAYEAEYSRFHMLTKHPQRDAWLVNWFIHQLDLQVRPFDLSYYA